ncbi:hypothetical protein F511_38997 [Dorcoceras hygrometricum]|uniref:Uncharacterized protein n=1 Tax=Dorcoceras hygrometricum TaxID=472368 RepID=A0A2Z7CT53_9LAMI|nr:hypothetical protein F511_38997 [Dorcoceras hygrometricum]
MKICWFCFELKLLLVDIAFSARLSEEGTRVSQHFGVLTIGFSSCAFVEELVARAVDRYDDVSVTHSLLLVLLSAGYCYGVVLISWNGVVLRCFVRLLLLVVAAEFYEGKGKIAADRLLLISSIDLGESAEFLVALETSREDLSFPTNLGGCVELERKRETAELSSKLRRAFLSFGLKPKAASCITSLARTAGSACILSSPTCVTTQHASKLDLSSYVSITLRKDIIL